MVVVGVPEVVSVVVVGLMGVVAAKRAGDVFEVGQEMSGVACVAEFRILPLYRHRNSKVLSRISCSNQLFGQ